VREHDRLLDRHCREQRRILERPDQTELRPVFRAEERDVAPVEDDVARVRAGEATEQLERRGLAGAVGSDQPDRLAGPDRERHVADGVHTAEALSQVPSLEQGPSRAGPSRDGNVAREVADRRQ
jgi:hypothetical protein